MALFVYDVDMSNEAEKITSPSNAHFKSLKLLLDSRGIKKNKRFLLAGQKTVSEALKNQTAQFDEILCRSPEDLNLLDPATKTACKKLKLTTLSSDLFSELDEANTKWPLLVGQLKNIPPFNLEKPPQGLELVLALGDPQNLGAIIRTAAALNVDKIILLSEACHPYHPKSMRASSASVLEAPLFEASLGIHDLCKEVYAKHLAALDLNGEAINQFVWPKNIRLLIGQEGPGIPNELQPMTKINIPINSKIDSLNAVAAATMALFSYRIKFPIN